MSVRSRSSRRHPPIHRSAIAFMRGVRMLQSTVWIVGAENLCHQAIFMNHASGAVAPPDAEVVQVGDDIWQRAKRGCLVQGAVWPVRVVEVLVLAQDGHQVALVPDQGPVQQLTPAIANQAPFRESPL